MSDARLVDVGRYPYWAPEQEAKQRLRAEHALRGTWERRMMGLQELIEPLVQVWLSQYYDLTPCLPYCAGFSVSRRAQETSLIAYILLDGC